MTPAQQRQRQRRQQQSGPDPSSVPHTAVPPDFRAEDHSWVLQTIMELHKSVGELTGAVNALTRAGEGQSKKIDELAEKVDGMRGGLGASRRIVGFLIALAGLLATAISIALWRLPAVIEALRSVEPGR